MTDEDYVDDALLLQVAREAESKMAGNSHSTTIDSSTLTPTAVRSTSTHSVTDSSDVDDELLIQAAAKAERQMAAQKELTTAGCSTWLAVRATDVSEIAACRLLKKYFGHSSFRPQQWEVINRCVSDRKDQLVVMSTGYGKSVCYQIPALLSNGSLSIVISPLVSLMEDQVQRMNAHGISALLFGSAKSVSLTTSKQNVTSGQYSVLYMTPEFVQGTGLRLLKEINAVRKIAVVAVDEAHCVSQWGCGFRSSYRGLGAVREAFGDVPFMALTATATPAVQRDIIASLHLRQPITTTTPLDRPNIFFRVVQKSTSMTDDLSGLLKTNQGGGAPHFGGPTIIYCATKATAETVNDIIGELGVQSMLYHAGLPLAHRREAHRSFNSDTISTIVATVEYGMGIDKGDVRHIIHYGGPRDLESYYQEIGRAGRDGSPSVCTVLYGAGDLHIYRYFLKDIRDPKYYEHKVEMLRLMEGYLTTAKCQRRFVLLHLDANQTPLMTDKRSCCDNCASHFPANAASSAGPLPDLVDFSVEARMLFEIISQVYGGHSGFGKPIGFVKGTAAAKVPEWRKRHQWYGQGSYRSEKWWKAFCQLLRLRGYFEERTVRPPPSASKNIGGYAVVSISPLARQWLRGVSSLMLRPTEQLLNSTPSPRKTKATSTRHSTQTSAMVDTEAAPEHRTWRCLGYYGFGQAGCSVEDSQLQENEVFVVDILKGRLEELRTTVSRRSGQPAYLIASNDVLLQLLRTRPTTTTALSTEIDGLSTEQIERYGDEFIKCIGDFCHVSGLSTDCFGRSTTNGRAELPMHLLPLYQSLPMRTRQIYSRVVLEGVAVDMVATERSISPASVVIHLCEAVKLGLPADLYAIAGLTMAKLQHILRIIGDPPLNSSVRTIQPIKDQLPPGYTYEQIRLAKAVFIFENRITGV